MRLRSRLDHWHQRYWERRRQGFTVPEAAWLASGRSCKRGAVYDVPVWLSGRHIATVRTPGATRDGAEDFALRYLKANLYPHKVTTAAGPLSSTGREFWFAGRTPETTPEEH